MKKLIVFLIVAFVLGFIAKIAHAALLSEQVIFNNAYDAGNTALKIITA